MAYTEAISPDLLKFPDLTFVDMAPISESYINVWSVASAYSAYLFNDEAETLIVLGRNLDSQRSDSFITIYDWVDNSLVNKTSERLSAEDSRFRGSEPDLEFGDFNGDGLLDVYIAPSTDSDVSRGEPGIFLINEGSNFNRINVDVYDAWVHDSFAYDLNGDGLVDIINTDFSSNSTIILGNPDDEFNTLVNNNSRSFWGAAGVVAGNFLNNNQRNVIFLDSSVTIDEQTRMFELLFYDVESDEFTMRPSAILPAPRFDLAKYQGLNETPWPSSHSIRALVLDFDADGIDDVVLITSPSYFINTKTTSRSEVQFLRSNGDGSFEDVTGDTLFNYNNEIQGTYNPKIIDFNNDGLLDIFLGGETWGTNSIKNTTVLLQTVDHKYISSFSNYFAALQEAVISAVELLGHDYTEGGHISVMHGPNDDIYLNIMASVQNKDSRAQEKAIYITRLNENIFNHAIQIDYAIENKIASAFDSFSVTLPEWNFTALEESSTVYTASLSNGEPLPPWLEFDSPTRVLRTVYEEGKASITRESIRVKVEARDASGDLFDEEFLLEIAPSDISYRANLNFNFWNDIHFGSRKFSPTGLSLNHSVQYTAPNEGNALHLTSLPYIGSQNGMRMPLAPTLTKAANKDAASISLSDVIASLKLFLGLDLPQAYRSPYNYVAADLDANGKVELGDVISLLKVFLGLPVPNTKAMEWVFVEESDSPKDINGIDFDKGHATPAPITHDFSESAEVNIVGILRGDVDGSWTPPSTT